MRRAVVAARAMARALHAAADIADEMRKVSESGRDIKEAAVYISTKSGN